jgi:membrane protein DedA with SNARE-associated domain
MEEFISHYGLLGIFVGAAIEGDIAIVIAGVTASLGLLGLVPAMAAAIAGCLVADSFWFGVAKSRAEAIRSTRVYRAVGLQVESLAMRLGPWHIVYCRFIYGTRIATMMLWGLRELPYRHFISLDILGCLIWAALLGALGFLGSSSAMKLLGRAQEAELWLLGFIVVVAGVVIVYKKVLQRLRRGRV